MNECQSAIAACSMTPRLEWIFSSDEDRPWFDPYPYGVCVLHGWALN
jgi:hypothetical protein